MPVFDYLALDPSGGTVKGVMEGDAERFVRAQLRERGLVPMAVTAIPEHDAQSRSDGTPRAWFRRSIGSTELTLLTRQFATLNRAGMTVEACLDALMEQTGSARTRRVLAGVRAHVREGQSLARAMGKYPESFPPVYRHLVDAGEQSGRLGDVLDRLADYTETRLALKNKVLLAMIYPALVTVVALAVVTGLLVYVVPQVTQVYAHTHQTLPLLTRILMKGSAVARATVPVLLPLCILAFIGLQILLRQETWQRRWHALQLRLPIWGRIARFLDAERFTRTLGILVTSGVPLLQAMQSAVPVVRNLPMRAAVDEASRLVREGGSLSRALGRSRFFPPIAIHLIASGETSGQLGPMLLRGSESLSRELETWATTLAALLEPLLILLMGAIVLFIVLATLLPIFEMNQLIR
jgi:general secretion pathway protein F